MHIIRLRFVQQWSLLCYLRKYYRQWYNAWIQWKYRTLSRLW